MHTLSRQLALSALAALLSLTASAQTTAANAAPSVPAVAAAASDPAAAPAFEVADIHASVHSNNPFMSGGTLSGDRFRMHQATMVDLIAKAYGVINNNVLSGPAWLDTDHFDVIAKAPRTTSPDDVQLMLRSLLADRFKLVVHNDIKSMPAYALTAGKGGAKMTASDGSGNADCQFKPPPPNLAPGTIWPITFTCHNMTMQAFAKNIYQWAGGDYLSNKQVVDSTGLKGSWDFEFKWMNKGRLSRAGDNAITIFDAVDKELGLKLEATTAPIPVLIVDSANEKPTPNAAGLDKVLPPPPPPEFDVTVVKPSPPDAKGIQGRINGDQVNLTGAPLQFLITFAWDIGDDMIADAPKWLNQDRFDILAKAAATDVMPSGPQAGPPIDIDDLRQMVKGLLADRFQMKSHMEDRPADAYTLFAVSPKLKKADPLNRTKCTEGPGPDGKDPRIANPILGRLLYCQNMTMAQFGDQLRTLASGYIHVPVLDSTGLDGAYDFTLSFSTAGQLRPGSGDRPPPSSSESSASSTTADPTDPTGGLSLPDAIKQQLGLKLEKQKRPVPMLVIDHIEEKPTAD